MDETVDGKKVGVVDAGSTPATSTNSLHGRNTHGVTAGYTKPPEYYYTENEWSRAIAWGTLPAERNKQLLTNEGGELDSTERIEILQEDSSTL